MYPIKQSTTAQPLLFLLVDDTDHVTGKTGLTPTVTLRKPGGSFASPAGAVTEIAEGWYQVAGNATDTNTLGPLVLHATGTDADPTDVVFHIVAYDPQDAVRAGLTSLPNAAAAASGGLPTVDASNAVKVQSGTGSNQISLSSGAVIIQSGTGTGQLSITSGVVNANAVQISGDSGAADNLESEYDGTGYLSYYRKNTLASATSTTATLDASATTTADLVVGAKLRIVSGTGAGQTRVITDYTTGRVATVDRAWATTPDGTSGFVVAYDESPALDSSLHVTANSSLVLSLEDEVDSQEFELSRVTGYDLDVTFTLTGVDSSDWSTFVFMIKRTLEETDAEARVLVRESNPSAGTDGLLLFNGTIPTASGLTADYASIAVTGTSPDTVARVIVRGGAMQLDPDDVEDGEFYAELARYDATGTPDPKVKIAGGTITLTRGVLRANTSP